MSEPSPRGPVTLGELALGVRDEFLQWDRGLIGTFIALAWRPAYVARAFIIKRDPRYVKPWRYLLFGVLVSITASWVALDVFGYRELMTPGVEERQASFLLDNAALLTLITLPVVALVMRLFFLGLSVRYVDALVMLFYTQGQVNLFGLVALVAFIATGSGLASLPVTIIAMLYFVWAWASFATGPWWRRILAALLTLVAGQAINAAIVLVALQIAR